MEQATEWYKRKIQVILFITGFLLAWFFNANTFVIVDKLSVDKAMRDKLVNMADSYVKKEKPARASNIDVSTAAIYDKKLDSLNQLKKELEADINATNSLLGLGGWLPDKIKVIRDQSTKKVIYLPAVESDYLKNKKPGADGYLNIKFRDKWDYLWWLFGHNIIGYLVTAIAISLGAPFWFDLLNKVMKLRTSTKQDTDSPGITSGKVSPLYREA